MGKEGGPGRLPLGEGREGRDRRETKGHGFAFARALHEGLDPLGHPQRAQGADRFHPNGGREGALRGRRGLQNHLGAARTGAEDRERERTAEPAADPAALALTGEPLLPPARTWIRGGPPVDR